ncbi:MAG: penicillin-binding protein 2 [Firmicutes bacterium]|nr:penicillin-binding protein 2 [Bacillota bacterium]
MWTTEKSRRMNIMTGIIAAVIIFLILRLGWMQLVNGPQYKKIAEENRIHQITAQAPRGNIYDRNGALLVSNKPSFAISIVPSEYTNARDATPILANIIGIKPGEIEKMLKDGQEFIYTPIRLKRDVDQMMLAKIQEHKYYLPGVMIEAIPVRYYVYKELAAHVFGFVGSISEEEYAKRKKQGYNPNDFIGKDGLEREWEDALRGVDGGLQVEVNALGEEIQIIGDKSASAGKGLVLTLDANLQKAAQDALAEQIVISRTIGEPAKGGSAVVLDVRTGAVLAMASHPTFDPNIFAGGISSLNWNKLINDPHNPLANKSIQNTYPPGSVFKIVTSAAALDMGYVTATEIFNDTGVYILNGWSFYGWETKGLGKLTIADAICWSSDPVFYELGHRMGVDNLASYALTFGLGQTTGIKLEGEEKGIVPTESWKQSTYGEEWYPGETIIAAIGQGYYLVTPLQQAMLLMAVANNGIIYRPMLVDKVLTVDGAVLEKYSPEVLRTVYLKPETWDIIKNGLVAVTNKGTASTVFQGFSPKVAGKTGSAETGTGTVHSWFACFAPADNPEIVVSVMVEDGGDGSVSAAPVTRKILEAYFGTRK